MDQFTLCSYVTQECTDIPTAVVAVGLVLAGIAGVVAELTRKIVPDCPEEVPSGA